MRNCQVRSSDDLLRILAGSSPRHFHLHRVTPAIVKILAGLEGPLELDLRGSELDEPQVRLLSSLGRLTDLTLLGVEGLTDAAVRTLLAIPTLRSLALLSSPVSEVVMAELHRYPWIEFFSFDNMDGVTDSVLAAVGRRPRLRGLYLEAWELERDSFCHLEAVSSLRTLQICGEPHDVDFLPLFVHRELEVLRLLAWGTTNTRADAERVVERIWSLEALTELRLDAYPTSSSVLAGVGALRGLRSLKLVAHRSLDSQVATAIATLPELRWLCAGRTPLVDADLEALASMPNLEDLRIMECMKITGGGVRALASLRSLDLLCLGGCRSVSMDDALWLADKLPDCFIQFPDKTTSAQRWSQEKREAFDRRIRAKRGR